MAEEATNGLGPLLLSNDEKRVLELHDRLQQLQLEIALITAQGNYVPKDTRSSAQGGDSVKAAQHELLDSRARYVLRNETVESVVVANPIMQAVHSGINASPIERDLLPALSQRDAASAAAARQAAQLRAVLDALTEVEGQAARAARENAALAAEVLRLAARSSRGRSGAADPDSDPDLAAEVAALEAQVRASRKKWRVVKAAAGAIVAGSGVDWARDAELRGIVLDEADAEEEDDAV